MFSYYFLQNWSLFFAAVSVLSFAFVLVFQYMLYFSVKFQFMFCYSWSIGYFFIIFFTFCVFELETVSLFPSFLQYFLCEILCFHIIFFKISVCFFCYSWSIGYFFIIFFTFLCFELETVSLFPSKFEFVFFIQLVDKAKYLILFLSKFVFSYYFLQNFCFVFYYFPSLFHFWVLDYF